MLSLSPFYCEKTQSNGFQSGYINSHEPAAKKPEYFQGTIERLFWNPSNFIAFSSDIEDGREDFDDFEIITGTMKDVDWREDHIFWGNHIQAWGIALDQPLWMQTRHRQVIF